MDELLTVRFELRMTATQWRMLKELALKQRRKKGDVLRVALERVHRSEMQRISEAAGRSESVGQARGVA